MSGESIENIQRKLELLTRKWWFFLLFILLYFVPPYTSKGYEPTETGMVVVEILTHSLAFSYPTVFPIFKIIPIVLVIFIILLKNAVTRIFNIYTGIMYILFAFLLNFAITEKHGLGILPSYMVMFSLVAAFWFWEAAIQRNDFASGKQSLSRFWVIPVAFLAFWFPYRASETGSLVPDFNPIYILTNEAGLTFCSMTPVYLAILTPYHPSVNTATLRVTSLAGLAVGLNNLMVNFMLYPSLLWWNGVLHIPLLTISLYALILSFKKIFQEKI